MSVVGHLTRRHFIRNGTLGALALGAGLAPTARSVDASASDPSEVTIVRDEVAMGPDNKPDPKIIKRMLDETMQRTTGERNARLAWSSLFKREDIIGIVATNHLNKTHAEVIDAVTSSLMEIGVPSDRILSVQGKVDEAAKCTALISLPALKAHWLTGIGTVMKNYIMFSNKPGCYHKEKSADLGEIWNLPVVKGKTRIVLVDALRPLFAQGPQIDPKYLWNYSGFLAGFDPVAVETVALQILQAKRNAYKGETWELTPPPLCVEAADKVYNLGTCDLNRIRPAIAGWETGVLIS